MTRISHAQARAMGLEKPKPKKPQRVSGAQWDAGTFPGGCWVQVPFVPPSLNEWSRWHWAKQKQYKDELTDNVKLLTLFRKLPRYERATVLITYYHATKRRRDRIDNFAPKFLMDALVRAEILVDDNDDRVKVETKMDLDQEKPRTEIFIWGDK
jgi:Holliday junction resolvase RusA-like endonuclease